MKIYIAGAWVEQHTRARPMIAAVRAAGLVVTCDWTQAEGDVCLCGCSKGKHYGAERNFDGYFGVCRECGPAGCKAFNGIGVGSDSALTPEQRRTFAQADLDGVLSADIVWLLAANDKGACGSWVELGAALAVNAWQKRIDELEGPSGQPIRIVVSGVKNKRTIFTELADKLFDTDAEALAYIAKEMVK